MNKSLQKIEKYINLFALIDRQFQANLVVVWVLLRVESALLRAESALYSQC